MKKSKDPKVQKFLEELKKHDAQKFDIVSAARAVVFKAYPAVSEKIMYDGIMFTREKDFGGLFVYKEHVSFEFSNGASFKNPKKLLEGSGKFRRHLKLYTKGDVKNKDVDFFVRQAGK